MVVRGDMNIITKLKGWPLLVIVLVIAAILPFIGLPRGVTTFLFLLFVYLAMANMWNLLCGYSGLISLCQPAFIGIAAYTMAILTWIGIPFYFGMIIGPIVAGIFALIISFPVFRLSGIYFAIGTLVVPEALRIVFYLWRPVGGALQGGGSGYGIREAVGVTPTELYLMSLAVVALSVIIVRIILRSKLGLGLAAIRDNVRTAATSGINVFNVKLSIFIIGAVVTGLAGCVFYASQQYIEPRGAFNISWTMMLMLATVIGGLRTEFGPVIGTAIVVALQLQLAKFGGLSLIVQGVILIAIMLLAPEGIVGFVGKIRGRGAYHRIMKEAYEKESGIGSSS